MEIVDSLQKNLKTNIGGDHPSAQSRGWILFSFFLNSYYALL